jgi:hypothetical protein
MSLSAENTIKYIEDGVLQNKTQLENLVINFNPATASENSISSADAIFLQLACLVEKPKKIMEIGTWLGTSTYAMAQASDALIYTCDQGPDNFYIHEGNDSYTNRIIRHPDTHSSKFLKNIDGGFDFVFVDGWLKDDDAEGIFEKCQDNFTFIAHDYYRPEKPKPVFCKGYQAVERMLKYAWENGYETELYPPSPDWYHGGFHVHHFGGVNACCAMIKFEKVAGLRFKRHIYGKT